MTGFMARVKTPSKQTVIQGSFFEDDYLEKSLGNISRDPDYALTELVANAWDAGSTRVEITVPQMEGKALVVEDNGTGMTTDEFKQRWMTLGYDRIKHQGKQVVFPPGVKGKRRNAWGRNGVGRHGMLCFAQSYTVTTRKSGKQSEFVVETSSGDSPFIITSENLKAAKGHGTRIVAKVERNLPDADRIRRTLSARFVHDPEFEVIVNDVSLSLQALPGADNPVVLTVKGYGKVEAQLIDSQKSARTKQQQGFTFWVEDRLVGDPSWTLDAYAPVDARTTFGRRYTILVKCDAFAKYVERDWSGFVKGDARNALFKAVNEYAMEVYQAVAKEKIEETTKQVFVQNLSSLKQLSRSGREDVAQFVSAVLASEPTIRPELLAVAIQAVVNLHQSKSGQRLIQKLANFQPDDIDTLDRILEEWSVQDAWAVLEEIDRRVAVIKAIEVLSARTDVDELHTLHPLVTDSRWLFGPEYDTTEYASNISLKNAVNKVFQVQTTPAHYDRWRKRMDLFLLADASMGLTGIEAFDAASELVRMDKVLLIELKKGGSEIGRKDVAQAEGYIEDIRGTGEIEGSFYTNAYIVGATVAANTAPRKVLQDANSHEYAALNPVSYSRLTRTASKRLFKLREKLEARYDTASSGQRSRLMDELLSQTDLNLQVA